MIAVHDLTHVLVIDAQDGAPVERQAPQKVDERLTQAGEVVAVGFHVVRVDVGHSRHHGRQIQEARI